MKRLFIYLLMLSSILCQDKLTTTQGDVYTGKVNPSEEGTIKFQFEDGYQKVFFSIYVQSLVLDDGTVIIDRGSPRKQNRSSENELTFTINLEKVGSGLIALSGALLFATNRMELDDDATIDYYEDMVDKIKLRTDIAYLSLAIGGLLLAIGEPAN